MMSRRFGSLIMAELMDTRSRYGLKLTDGRSTPGGIFMILLWRTNAKEDVDNQ